MFQPLMRSSQQTCFCDDLDSTFAPPDRSLPSLNITALSYSLTTCSGLKRYCQGWDTNLDTEYEGERESGEAEEDGEECEEESTAARTLSITLTRGL